MQMVERETSIWTKKHRKNLSVICNFVKIIKIYFLIMQMSA